MPKGSFTLGLSGFAHFWYNSVCTHTNACTHTVLSLFINNPKLNATHNTIFCTFTFAKSMNKTVTHTHTNILFYIK